MLARIPDTYDKRDTSPIPTALSPAAYEMEGLYMVLNQVQNSAFVETAASTDLDNLAILGGIRRREASPAVRLGIFNVAVPIGSRFSVPDGTLNFVVTASTSTALQYQLTAETDGAIGNAYFGAILPITSIQGLNSAILSDILIAGEDIEDDTDLRARLIERLNEKPFGGNVASYREAILAVDGVGAVQVYPVWNGGGTVKCALLSSTYGIPSSTLIDTVQELIDPTASQGEGLGVAPIGAQVTIVAGQSLIIDVEANILCEAGYNVQQLHDPIEEALEAYLLSLRRAWDTPHGTGVSYALAVYVSRILAAIVGVQGVANASGITLNGSSSDIILTETGASQQVPFLGTVTLHAV